MSIFLDSLFYSFSICFYVFIFLRIFAPFLIKGSKESKNIKKFNLNALSENVDKVSFVEKLHKLGRQDAKILFFRAIGKTDKEIKFDKLSTWAKNILKFSPMIYGLFFDLKSCVVFSYSLALCFFWVKILKKTTKQERPDKSNSKSFPSGHSSHASNGFFYSIFYLSSRQSFDAMFVLHISILLIFWIFVLYSRLAFKRHRAIDVLAGVCIGFASTSLIKIIFYLKQIPSLNSLKGLSFFDFF
jgi:hypothetical protein